MKLVPREGDVLSRAIRIAGSHQLQKMKWQQDEHDEPDKAQCDANYDKRYRHSLDDILKFVFAKHLQNKR